MRSRESHFASIRVGIGNRLAVNRSRRVALLLGLLFGIGFGLWIGVRLATGGILSDKIFDRNSEPGLFLNLRDG